MFNLEGAPILAGGQFGPSITLKHATGGYRYSLTQLLSHRAHKTLGYYITLCGNQVAQLGNLQQKVMSQQSLLPILHSITRKLGRTTSPYFFQASDTLFLKAIFHASNYTRYSVAPWQPSQQNAASITSQTARFSLHQRDMAEPISTICIQNRDSDKSNSSSDPCASLILKRVNCSGSPFLGFNSRLALGHRFFIIPLFISLSICRPCGFNPCANFSGQCRATNICPSSLP